MATFKYIKEKLIATIPKNRRSSIVVRIETNEFNRDVIDIRVHEEGKGFTKHGITFPVELKDPLIAALSSIKMEDY